MFAEAEIQGKCLSGYGPSWVWVYTDMWLSCGFRSLVFYLTAKSICSGPFAGGVFAMPLAGT